MVLRWASWHTQLCVALPPPPSLPFKQPMVLCSSLSPCTQQLGFSCKQKQLGFQHDPEIPTSAYVHLPFCRRRCFYCDFTIVAVGERNESTAANVDSTMAGYVDSVCSEIASTFQRSPLQVRPLKTVFFGGGTPSLLPPQLLQRIIDSLERCCALAPGVEISMEMDPGTFDKGSLRDFLSCGVNRVSLGVQAFQDDLLQACGRAHGLRDVYDAIETIHECGLKNWSLDLISSLPHQTRALWEESLRKAVDARSAHVSVYDLQVEEGTKFGRWYNPGQHPLPSEESSAAFYKLASSVLREAGFEHYEISNYARPGYQCQHNLVYWQNLPYYAFGLGATSYMQGRRFSRPKKWKEYANFVKNMEATTLDLESTGQSMEDRLSDTVMLSLRLARGIDLVEISQSFGVAVSMSICNAFLPFVNTGHAVALDGSKRPVSVEQFSTSLSGGTTPFERDVAFIRLSDPEGFLFSNEIISSVFSVLPGA